MDIDLNKEIDEKIIKLLDKKKRNYIKKKIKPIKPIEPIKPIKPINKEPIKEIKIYFD